MTTSYTKTAADGRYRTAKLEERHGRPLWVLSAGERWPNGIVTSDDVWRQRESEDEARAWVEALPDEPIRGTFAATFDVGLASTPIDYVVGPAKHFVNTKVVRRNGVGDLSKIAGI